MECSVSEIHERRGADDVVGVGPSIDEGEELHAYQTKDCRVSVVKDGVMRIVIEDLVRRRTSFVTVARYSKPKLNRNNPMRGQNAMIGQCVDLALIGGELQLLRLDTACRFLAYIE